MRNPCKIEDIRIHSSLTLLESLSLKFIFEACSHNNFFTVSLAIPVFSAALAANPETKIIVHDGGQKLGNAEAYAKAAGYGAGELLQVGFDTSPQIMTAFENGYVHLTSDQQPFLQGYLPVLDLCQMKVLGTGALNQDTGAGFVHTENYKSVMELANAGLR